MIDHHPCLCCVQAGRWQRRRETLNDFCLLNDTKFIPNVNERRGFVGMRLGEYRGARSSVRFAPVQMPAAAPSLDARFYEKLRSQGRKIIIRMNCFLSNHNAAVSIPI